MEVKATKVDSINILTKAKITKSYIDKKVNEIAKELAKNETVAGFRKGKVPVVVIKKMYGGKLVENAHNEALKDAYEKSLKDLNIEADSVVGEPSVPKFEKKDGGFEAEIKYNLRPTVEVEGYKDLVPQIPAVEVSEEEIKERTDSILKAQAILKPVKDRDVLENGDTALIDFEGFIDGKAFEGGKGEAYALEIGSNTFIPGFEEQMIGMRIEEERDIVVSFPKEYGSADLAGKEATFKVKLLEIQTKDIPTQIDEELAKKILPGVEGADANMVTQEIKKQIENEKRSKIFMEDVKPKYVDTLIEKYDFDLPEGIVEQEIDLSLRNLTEDELKELNTPMQDATQEEKEAFNERLKAKRESLREDAKKSVKLTFIVDELARIEKIEVNDSEVKQTIMYEAIQMQQDPQKYLQEYEKQGLLPAVKMAIIEDRLFNKIFSEKLEA